MSRGAALPRGHHCTTSRNRHIPQDARAGPHLTLRRTEKLYSIASSHAIQVEAHLAHAAPLHMIIAHHTERMVQADQATTKLRR